MQQKTRLAAAACLATLPALWVTPQDETSELDVVEVTIGEQGSDQDPLSGRDRGLIIEDEPASKVRQVKGILGVPAMSVQLDPRVLGVAPGEPLPKLRREGESVRKRDGKLLPTGERGYAVFILDADLEAGDKQPLAMVVAPCLTLESMERLQDERGDDLRFTITGEVHTYLGVNYLLPTSQPRPWLLKQNDDDDNQEPSKDTEASTDQDTPATNDPSTETGGEDQDADADDETDTTDADATPTADEVLQELLRERNDAPQPIVPSVPREDEGILLSPDTSARLLTDPLLLGLDPDQPQAELKNEGEFLISRTGRLIRSADGSQALFVLDADQQGAAEPPMILHACKLLQTMEKTVREQGDEIPFIVTGQVFIYRGANYLLPTIVKREFDLGNLE